MARVHEPTHLRTVCTLHRWVRCPGVWPQSHVRTVHNLASTKRRGRACASACVFMCSCAYKAPVHTHAYRHAHRGRVRRHLCKHPSKRRHVRRHWRMHVQAGDRVMGAILRCTAHNLAAQSAAGEGARLHACSCARTGMRAPACACMRACRAAAGVQHRHS